MAKDKTKRLSPKIIAEDNASLEALETITGYSPVNSNVTLVKLKTLRTDVEGKRATATQALAAADSARDDVTAKEWEYHEAIVSMRDQVVAQYGRDSNEAQSVGRKKESERKAPSKKSQT